MNNPLQSGQTPQNELVTLNAEPVTRQSPGSNLQIQVLAPSPLSLAPTNQYPAAMVQYAAPARRARHGKIARLPYPERDMVNRMLRDNIPYSSIVEALAEIGIRVTERNVSNWKTRGGYHDWRAEQDRAVDARLLQDNLTEYLRKDDAAELPEVGLQLAATQLSHFFTKPETQQQLATDPEKYARTISVLCRLAGQIQSPQKDRDVTAKKLGQNPARDKQEAEEEVENVRSVYSAARLGKSGNEANIPRRNYMPKA